MKISVFSVTALLATSCLSAQDPNSLSRFFEGRPAVVKIDMPGSQQGIDIYPQRPSSLDAKAYGRRMKLFPVAVHNGESVMVTTVKVKDKLIEFQLGGGGYGAFGDDTDTSTGFSPERKSDAEKDLEDKIKRTSDARQKDRLQEKLDYLRRQRDRDDQRNRAIAEHEAEMKKQRVDQQRTHGGSRFNLKYEGPVPPGLTPQDIMLALEPYVSFSTTAAGVSVTMAPPPPLPPADGAADPALSLKKGMPQEQVRSLLGTPSSVSDVTRDGLQVHTEIFTRTDSNIRAQFVNGVLVSYSIDVH